MADHSRPRHLAVQPIFPLATMACEGCCVVTGVFGMMSHRSRAKMVRDTADGADSSFTHDPVSVPLVPVDLLAREPDECGQAGVGFVSVLGWVYDEQHGVLGRVDADGCVWRGGQQVALVEHGTVIASAGGRRGGSLGTVRTVVRPAYEMAYLCDHRGDVNAVIVLDREVLDLDHERFIQLAGAALALLAVF